MTVRQKNPTAQAMEVLGDRWTLLVVSAVLRDVHRFGQLQRELGIARTVLASRLQVLVEHGILARRRYHTDPDWYEYRLTSEGRALEPVIQALSEWSRTHFSVGSGSDA
jgi:DNA-binding HxlR family transcriptional regulator